MAKTPKEWASAFFGEARTLDGLLDLRRLVDNEWTGCGRYYVMCGGLARAEIDAVYHERLMTFERPFGEQPWYGPVTREHEAEDARDRMRLGIPPATWSES